MKKKYVKPIAVNHTNNTVISGKAECICAC